VKTLIRYRCGALSDGKTLRGVLRLGVPRYLNLAMAPLIGEYEREKDIPVRSDLLRLLVTSLALTGHRAST